MPVQYLHHLQPGAPTLSGTAGSLVSLLNAVLLDGYNLVNVSSLSHSAGTATATYGVAHGLNVGDTFEIGGAKEAAWNGKYRVQAITLTTVTFTVPLATAASATGTLSSKIAPLGWSRPFTGTNKAVYRSADAGASGAYYRFDDAGALGAHYAQVRMYEAMSDGDSGTDPTPTITELPNGLFFCKSNAQDGTARKWRVVGDERAFWLLVSATPNQGYDSYFCGDVVSWKDPDPWCAALWGKESTGTGVGHAMYGARTFKQDTYDTGRFLMRQALGGGKAQRHRVLGHGLNEDAQGATHPFPNATTGGMLVAPALVLENSGTAIRGWMPGIYQSYHNGVVGHGSTAQVSVNGQDRTLLGISNVASLDSRQYVALFDITGPWR